jgi:hypothetical protein
LCSSIESLYDLHSFKKIINVEKVKSKFDEGCAVLRAKLLLKLNLENCARDSSSGCKEKVQFNLKLKA